MGQEKIYRCYESIRERIPFRPKLALVLGSGLGDYADTVQVRIENKIYTQEQIKPTEYCEQTNELTVRLLDELRQVLADTPIHKITVISDLRFLVKRVEDWYRSYGL